MSTAESAQPATREPTPTAAPRRPARAPKAADGPASVRPHSRPENLRRAPASFRISMILFFIGGLALLAMVVLFASGVRDLPWWLWVLVALAGVGLIIGSFTVGRAGRALESSSDD